MLTILLLMVSSSAKVPASTLMWVLAPRLLMADCTDPPDFTTTTLEGSTQVPLPLVWAWTRSHTLVAAQSAWVVQLVAQAADPAAPPHLKGVH